MGHIKLNNAFELSAGNVTVFGEFSQKLKNNKKAAALGTTPLALILSACGSDTTTTASSNLLTLTKSADTYSASAVTGFTVADSSTAKFDVADATSNAYQIKLDATGTGVLEFDFADAGDTVTLEAGSKSSGFTTLKVTDGTLDATNADLTGITRVEVASGIKISLAQIKVIPTIVASSATAEVTVEVASEAEATELVSLISAGTVSIFADTNPIKLVSAPTATVATETLTAKQTETTASVKPEAEAPADTAVADTTTDTGTSTDTGGTTTDSGTTTDTGTTTGGTSGGGGGGVVDSGPDFAIIQSGVGEYIVGTTNGNVTLSANGDLVTFTPTTGVAVNKVAADISTLRVDDITLTTTSAMAVGKTITGNGNVTLSASDDAQTIALSTTGTNTIDVGAGADTVTAATGTNNITTGTGADTINLTTTSGAQTVSVTSENGVTNLINATGAGATYAVNLAGTTAGTVTDASGSTQTVTITGTTAADTFEGGTGADAFVGLGGDDIYIFDGTAQVAAGESITEASSGGTDTVKLTDTTSFANMTAASFDEIDQIEIVGAKTGTFTGAQLTGETIALLGGTGVQSVVIGATGGGTTDLSGITAGTGWTAGTDTIAIGGADGTAEVITGTATNDAIDAADGNDTVNGGAGADTITMGAGTDTVAISSIVGTSSGSVSSAGSGANDDVGTDTVSELLFASGSDVVKIVATNVDSFVHATDTDIGLGTGTDTAGTAAAYTVKTGLIDLNQANNNVFTDAGDIVVTFVTTDTFDETNFEAHLAYDLTADADGTGGITGGGLADTLTGGAGADTLTGGAGNDTLTGAGGADTLDGEAGDDTLVVTSDSASESYTGGADTDTLQVDVDANLSNDTLATLEVLDLHEDGTAVAVTMTDAQIDAFSVIKSAASAIDTGDIITMGDAMTSDMLDGTRIGAGTDADEIVFILKDVASNALTVHNDTLVEAGDKLFIDGSALTGTNALTFNGSAEATAAVLTVTGGAAADTLTGGAGADVLSGGAGADIITGGTGIDTLTGGADADSFIFTDIVLAANANNIADFLGDGTGQDLLKFDNGELGGISGSASGATGNTAVVTSALGDTASATIDAAIDGATGTTSGQQIVIIAGGVSGGAVATAAQLEAGAEASDLTGSGYLVIADSATAGRVFYDADFNSGTDGAGFIQVASLTGTLLTAMSIDSVAIL